MLDGYNERAVVPQEMMNKDFIARLVYDRLLIIEILHYPNQLKEGDEGKIVDGWAPMGINGDATLETIQFHVRSCKAIHGREGALLVIEAAIPSIFDSEGNPRPHEPNLPHIIPPCVST